MIANYSKQPIVLYGMGNLGKRVLRSLLIKDVSVIACLDKTPKNTHIGGIPVYKPEAFNPGTHQDFIVAVCIVTISFCEIYDYLKSIGFKNIYHISNILNNGCCIFEEYWKLSKEEAYNLEKEKISQIFFDRNSERAYLEAVDWLLTGTENIISKHESFNDKYWLSGIKQMFRPKEVIVDCGAYDGDNIVPFLKSNFYTDFSFHAFEPADHNFSALKKNCRSSINTVHFYNFGLGNEESIRLFLEDGDSSRYIFPYSGSNTALGHKMIKPLDLVMEHERYTILKVAAEGMEFQVLQGAASTIKKYRPLIIVNLHHSKTDFLHIPTYARKTFKDYDLYLKLHGYCGQEIVLYAVPSELDGLQLVSKEES